MYFSGANRNSLILYALVTLFVIALFLDGNPVFERFELSVQDSMFGFRGERTPSGDVEICALDDVSLDDMGWPLKRDKLARLFLGLRAAGPSAIVCDFDWRNVAPSESVQDDSLLLWSLSGDDRVVLPLSFTYADLGVSVPAAPSSYRRSAWTERFPPGSAVAAQALFGPEQLLADSASAVGGITPMLDGDRVIRWSPLLIDYGGTAFASSVLWAVSLHRDVIRTSWWLEPGQAVKFGERRVPTDARGRVLLNYLGSGHIFTHHSAANFLKPQEPNKRFSGKIIVVGPTGYQGSVNVTTRLDEASPSVEVMATAIENVIHGQFIKRPTYSALFDLLVLILIGLFSAVVLPNVSLLFRFVVLSISLFVVVNLQYLMFASFGWITHAFYPALELVFFMAVSPFIRARDEVAEEERQAAARRQPAARARAAARKKAEGEPAEEHTQFASGGIEEPTAFKGDTKTVAVAREDKTRATDLSAPAPTVLLATEPSRARQEARESAAPALGFPMADATATPLPTNAGAPASAPASGSGRAKEETQVGQTQPPQPADLQYLGRYQLLEELGRGAMGIVYRGIDPAINRPVALKTVRLDLAVPPAEKEELRTRLLREAQAAGQLSHPNIVTIYDVGSQGDIHYIAMEFLKGYTLERAVAKKMTLNYKIFAKLMIQVCDALEYAHGNELVHRDIKPANIMVMDNFKVKVMDFGIARVAHSNMTQTGVALGTPSYISPEQLAGQGVDRRSDVFSLGVVMYELLTKEKPFKGDTINKLIFNILNEKPRRPTEMDNNIPQAFDTICAKALEKDPRQRYQYAADLARDLKEFMASMAPQKMGI